MFCTIRHNSGGYHGHQLKDYFGGLAIAKLLNIKYFHTPYDYLSFFSLGHQEKVYPAWKRYLNFYKTQVLSGPYWDGFEQFLDFETNIKSVLNRQPIKVFQKALRVHPHQTIPWYREGLIQRDVFNEIVSETTEKFQRKHQLEVRHSGKVKVAMHISRGVDFDRKLFPEHFESSFNVRYMFSIDYFLAIYQQLYEKYGSELQVEVFTEELNSDDIVKAFQNKDNVSIRIGSNRAVRNDQLIYDIFRSFIVADILVSCNSSFSTMAIFFRGEKVTIYHPHLHMHGLIGDQYLSTAENGTFNNALLPEFNG